MELKDVHGAILAKISLGAIYSSNGEIIAYVRKNTVKDPLGVTLGFVRHGMVLGPNGEGLALYSSNSLSTYSKSSTINFAGTKVTDVTGRVLMQMSEEYLPYMEVLIAYIVFFSEIWRDQKHVLTLSMR